MPSLDETAREINRIVRLDAQFRARNSRSRSGKGHKRTWRRLNTAINRNRSWTCHLCGRPFHDISEVSVDHVVPASARPHGEPQVLDLAHHRCNNERANVPIVLYRMFQIACVRLKTSVADVFPGRLEQARRRARGRRHHRQFFRRKEREMKDADHIR